MELTKDRELLGADTTEDMQAIAGAVGRKYLISLTVMPVGSDQVNLSAKRMDVFKGSLQENMSKMSNRGDAALDAIDALAEQFVNSLGSLSQFSKGKCVPTNQWAGTISYKSANSRESTSGGPTVNDGTESSTITNTNNFDIRVKLGWTGKAQATVNIKESINEHKTVKSLINCARRGYSYKSAGMDKVTQNESSIDQTVDVTVNVRVQKGRYIIGVSISIRIRIDLYCKNFLSEWVLLPLQIIKRQTPETSSVIVK